MHTLLQQLENRVELGPVKTAKLLGFNYRTYWQYQTGLHLQQYTINHIKSLLRMTDDQLDAQIREVVYGN